MSSTTKQNLLDYKLSDFTVYQLKELKKHIAEELKKREVENKKKVSVDTKTSTDTKKKVSFTRDDMKTVLKRNNIKFNETMKRSELLEIVKKHNLVGKVKEYHSNKAKAN